MSIIDEIKRERINRVPEEYKSRILENIKFQLIDCSHGDWALIDGAAHYPNQEWEFPSERERARFKSYTPCIKAPFRFHEAIAEWLRTLGFSCCRHYNRGGVDNGMEIRIR